MAEKTIDQVWDILKEVKDPEIPAVSVVEMGMIRSVELDNGQVHITMTPTFAGCPAIQFMYDEIKKRLNQAGVGSVEVQISHNPPWSSDWITPEAREKLKQFGLAPPPIHKGNFELMIPSVVTCPYCQSENTVLKNRFGPTLCRSIYYCNDCQQPFEQFKPI